MEGLSDLLFVLSESFLLDLLLSPAYVLTGSFYQAPLVSAACLYEAAELYGCFPGIETVM